MLNLLCFHTCRLTPLIEDPAVVMRGKAGPARHNPVISSSFFFHAITIPVKLYREGLILPKLSDSPGTHSIPPCRSNGLERIHAVSCFYPDGKTHRMPAENERKAIAPAWQLNKLLSSGIRLLCLMEHISY